MGGLTLGTRWRERFDMPIQDKSISELEFRINVVNYFLKWLRSDDPMLTDPKYSQYVPERIEQLERQRDELTEVCRQKKVERDGDPNTDPVSVGLKPASLSGKAGMG
jgi:hypothetical protein